MSQPHSEQIGELAAALAAAQGEFPEIPKLYTAKVTTRTGGSYEFKYADLETILSTVRPILAKHGIALTISLDTREMELPPEKDRSVKTLGVAATGTLFHTSGQWLQSSPFCVPVDPDMLRRQYAQAGGSAGTYATRYMIEALLAIRATEDDDGNGASGNTAAIDKLPPPPPKPKPAPPPVQTKPTLHAGLAAFLNEFGWPADRKAEFANKLLAHYEVKLADLVTDPGRAAAVLIGLEAEVKALMAADALLTERADALQVLFSKTMEAK